MQRAGGSQAVSTECTDCEMLLRTRVCEVRPVRFTQRIDRAMLRTITVLLASFLVTAPSYAGTWADPMFSELNKDFGSVPRGPVLKHVFTVKNTTGQTVRAVQLRVSCGCTVARMEDSVLNPGQSTTITANMDSSRFLGDRTVYIYVLFDQPSVTEVTMSVHARSHEDVVLTPDTVDFGRGPRGVARKFQTTVTVPVGEQWKIENVVSDTGHVTASVAPAPAEQGPNRFVVTAQLDDELPVGNWHTELWLQTNHPLMPRIRIPVKAVVEANLVATPADTTLSLSGTETAHRKVLIRGASPFAITAIKGGDKNWIVAEDSPAKSNNHILTLTLTGPIEAPRDRTFEVVTDLTGDNKVTFHVHADGGK